MAVAVVTTPSTLQSSSGTGGPAGPVLLGPGSRRHGDILSAGDERLQHPQGSGDGREAEANGVLAVCIKINCGGVVVFGSWLLPWNKHGDTSHHLPGSQEGQFPCSKEAPGAQPASAQDDKLGFFMAVG